MTYVRRKHSLTHLQDSIVTFHDQPYRRAAPFDFGGVFGGALGDITVESRAFSLSASLKTIAQEEREVAPSRGAGGGRGEGSRFPAASRNHERSGIRSAVNQPDHRALKNSARPAGR